MFFDSYEEALQYLKDHYGGFHEVANATEVDVGGRWLHQTLMSSGKNPSEKVRRAIMDHAEEVREESIAESRGADMQMVEKIKDLHDEYGSWDRVGRRIGAEPNALRLAVTEGARVPAQVRQKVNDATRRSELEELIGFICVGIGLQIIDALEHTDLSHDQQKIVDKGAEQLQDYNRLLQTGNMQELRDAIRDSIGTLGEPSTNGYDSTNE